MWLIYKYFAVSGTYENMLQMSDLMKVEWTKDAEMADFLERWEKVVNRLQFRPSDEHLRDVLLMQLRKSAALKHQIEQWDQMEDEDANKTYQWLLSQVARKIDQQRMRTNLKDMQHTIVNPGAGGGGKNPAAVGAEPPKAKNCKFGAHCTTPGCQFKHPGGERHSCRPRPTLGKRKTIWASAQGQRRWPRPA